MTAPHEVKPRGSGASTSEERDAEACFTATRGLCNSCGKLVDAKVVFRDERVYLVKWCGEHGRSEALVCSDLDWYKRSLSYIKPGTKPQQTSVESFVGCPESCGLCAEHQQHTCVPILEVTERCDLSCPICLVGGPGRGGDVPLSQVETMIDQLVRCEGQVNMLNISGGEPTLHRDFLGVVDAARRPEVGIVSVSTDGLALARDDDLIRALRDRDVVISLQYDGCQAETYAKLRGRADLAEIKTRLVERIIALGARLSLTVTLARGVNEHELEGVLQLLFDNDQVLSVMVQPMAHTGSALERFPGDPNESLTIPDVVRLLAAGSRGRLEASDFSPLPCSHPSCFALTYLLRTEAGRLVPLPRLIASDDYLDIIKNEALFGTDTDSLQRVKDSLYALWSSDGMVPDRDAVLKTVRQILLDLNKTSDGGSAHREVLSLGTRHVKSIFIHHFMDRYTFDLSRAMKCCNHYPQPDGRLLPACIRNNGL